MQEIKERTLYTFHTDEPDQVSGFGQDYIWGLLTSHTSLRFSMLADVLQDFHWVWKTRDGTLPKRISRTIYNRFKVKLADKLLSEIGNVAKQETLSLSTVHFDFTSRIAGWKRGNFADPESCFWTCHADAIPLLKSIDTMAIRFFTQEPDKGHTRRQYYKKQGGYAGLGRAWLIPHKPQENIYTLMNGYGLPLNRIAYIFSEWTNQSYKRISLFNHGRYNGLFFINNGTGYVVGTKSRISKYERYDFKVMEPGWLYECMRCQELIDRECVYMTYHGTPFCWECAETYCVKCNACGCFVEPDKALKKEGKYYCNSFCLDTAKIKYEFKRNIEQSFTDYVNTVTSSEYGFQSTIDNTGDNE